jgi:hypothetical protein
VGLLKSFKINKNVGMKKSERKAEELKLSLKI